MEMVELGGRRRKREAGSLISQTFKTRRNVEYMGHKTIEGGDGRKVMAISSLELLINLSVVGQ